MPPAATSFPPARSSASKESSQIRRRGTVTGIAAAVGSFAFLLGLLLLFAIPAIDTGDPRRRLFELNIVVSSAIVYAGLGGFLVVQAASALGGAPSSPMRYRWAWLVAPVFPLLVVAGQILARNPERLPWLFPFVNVGIVAIPSLVIAAVVARRYLDAQHFAWPLSWREWTSALIYGAVGATIVAAIVNTGYLAGMGTYLLSQHGASGANLDMDGLATLPRGWGIFLDLSTLSVVAPLNEEFWKGMLVAFFFFRRGGAARCFAWGVLAGAGFNLLETFQNSLAVISPEAQASQQIGDQFWLFAAARGGTAAMHALAAGLSALGWYGLLRRRPRYLVGYPAAVCLHASWNFLVYVIAGDAMFSGQGPDSRLLDIAGIAGLIAVFTLAVTALWHLSGRLRDDGPAPLYRLLGMVPRAP